MNRRFPEQESAEATEGTAAHWVSWQILAGNSIQVGNPTPGGSLVTEEMIECGELVSETIRARASRLELNIERTIPCSLVSQHSWGTPDAWGTSPDLTKIEIFDLKFGHRFVDEWWNPQGLCYLAGILEEIQKTRKIAPVQLEPVTQVSFTVIQPRCFYRGAPVRTHTFKLSETREKFNQLSNMAEAATLSNPTATTNDHCGDCPGRHACTALQLAVYTDAEYSNARTPVELAPAAAALELKILMRALDRLQARVDGLKEQTIANLRAGKQVPFFRAEPGYGRQVWKIPDDQVISIGKLFGQDLGKSGVITPKQAEKAGVDPSVIGEFSFTPSTGFRLVTDNLTDAPRTFGALNSK